MLVIDIPEFSVGRGERVFLAGPGGSVQNLGGLQCIDRDRNGVNNTIVAWLATAVGDTGDGTYAIEGVEYRLRGTELSEVGVRTLQANVSEADFVYANLTCGGVSL